MNTQFELHIERYFNDIKAKYKLKDSDKQIFMNQLQNTQKEIYGKSQSLLNPWLQIYEELIYSLHLVQRVIRAYWEAKKKKDRHFFGPMLLIGKACVESCAIRSLILNGFCESARTNFRTLIENLQLFIVLYYDKNLSLRFEEMSYQENGEDKFWYENVSKGKLEKRLNNIISNIEFKGDFFKNHNEQLKVLKKSLSSSVHSSCTSSFQSWMTVSLENPKIMDMSTIGKISGYTPEFIQLLNHFIYGILALFVEISLSVFTSKFNRYKKVSDELKILSGRLYVYSEIIPIYNEFTKKTKRFIDYRT